MANLSPLVRQQAFKLGLASPGAKLYTWLSGTSTPQVVYLDAALSTPATNPLVADSTGRFAAFWLAELAYRMELRDSADVTIWGPTDGIANGFSGAPGTAGQVLTSTGAGTAPTFQTPAAASATVTSTTATGTVNDLAISGRRGVLRCNNATLLTINGFTAGNDGDMWDIISIGAGQVDLANQNAGSVAANRIINNVTATISLAAGNGRARIIYDQTTARWRVLEHEQGAWITPTFAAGDYTAGSGTWTVDSGDVATCAYWLKGRTLTFAFQINNTDVSATPSTLIRTLPGGFTAAKTVTAGIHLENSGTGTDGFAQVAASGTTVIFARNTGTFSTTASDNTAVQGEITFEVQ